MAHRAGAYIVPTHRWYIERTVWLIAGIVLLFGSALALLIDPLWIFAVTATGLVSINVALTGFCPVGNLLRLFGFTPMLGRTPVCVGISTSCRPTAGILSGAFISSSALTFPWRPFWCWRTAVGGLRSLSLLERNGLVRRHRLLHYGKHAVLARRRTAPQPRNGPFRPLCKLRHVVGLC